MDTEDSQNKVGRQLRRSIRQSSSVNSKALSCEPTPRGPLKRTRKKPLENKAPVAATNGSKDVENDSEDGDSPSKKPRTHLNGGGDDNEMDIQESPESLEKTEELEMDVDREPINPSHQTQICSGAAGDVKLHAHAALGETYQFSHAVNSDFLKTQRGKQSKKEPILPPKSAAQSRPSESRHDAHATNRTSMEGYRRKMEEKIPDKPKVNHYVPRVYEASQTTQRRVNHLPPKTFVPVKKQEGKRKTAVAPQSSGGFLKGFLWCLWQLILLVLISSGVFLAYKNFPVLQRTRDGAGHPSQSVNSGMFVDKLSLLEAQFPSQRPELWKRSKIHLQKHLETTRPTEPVSLILTAGRRAERTLHCLARSLASAFSSALNASVLHIDGVSKASQDSDEVKLDIDSQLRAAFEGDKPVAVIHRFEELPPGSTIIFYRYCDHENAAYKRVFLLFTVLLPQDEVGGQLNLKEVEEIVQDYVKERLVSNETAFNKMDNDKYGGLWSRISHLILPVASEKEVEQRGC